MARRRVRGMVTVVGGVVATLVGGLLTAAPADAATPPVITSISVSTNAVQAPGEVVLSYTATADAPLNQALAGYKDPSGRLYTVSLSKGASGSGTRKIPDGVQNGTWKLQYLYLDTAVDAFTYACSPAYVSSKCTENRDLSPYDVVVSGSTEDFEAPALSSVSVTPTAVRPATPLTVRFTADDLHPIVRARASWKHRDRDAYVSLESVGAADLADGTFTQSLPKIIFNGEYSLSSLELRDANGFAATYRVDGTVSYSATPGVFYPQPTRPAGAHAVSFAASSFSVTGAGYDGPAPVLTSLSVTPRLAVSGGNVTVAYAARSSSALLRAVSADYVLEGAADVVAHLWAEDVAATGRFSSQLPQRVGTYRLVKVTLRDSSMRTAEYGSDGRVRDERGTVIGTHELDFAGQGFLAKPSALSVTGRSRPQSAELNVATLPDEPQDLTSYRIVVSPGATVIDVPATSDHRTVVVPGLRNGTTYTFSVTSQSKVGPGATTKVTVVPTLSGNIWSAGDVDRDKRNDLFARLPDGRVRLYGSAGYPRWKTPTTVVSLPSTRNFPSGNIRGYAAFLTINGDGGLEGNMVNTNGTSRGSTVSGTGWGSMRSIDGSADLTGDALPDIVAVTSSGVMRIYRGDGNGRFTAPIQVGTGWGPMLRVFVPGDVTGDRRTDVMAVDSAGVLWIYPGNGRGGFTTRKRVGSGWGGMGAVFAARDLNGDGRADLGAVTMDGKLRLYPGRGNGTFGSPATIGSGWNTFF